MLIKVINGIVYDPANGINGRKGEIWLQNGRVVYCKYDSTTSLSHFEAEPYFNAVDNPIIDNSIIDNPIGSNRDRAEPDRVIDASNCIIMPGGIDIHAHIAGPKVNTARKLRPELQSQHTYSKRGEFRSGSGRITPSTFVTGYLYAGMGYTTVFDAAIPPLTARHAHEEFHDTPLIDKGFFVLIGNHCYALQQIKEKRQDRLTAFAGWLLRSTKGYALKLVNPGGVENWKHGDSHRTRLDTKVTGFDITPREIIQSISQTAMDLKLPHPIHLHANQLGVPGNWQTTLETMVALEGRKAHLTHIQFHSYGGSPDEPNSFASNVQPLINYVNSHDNLTIDVGQVQFGQTTSMTGDGPLGYYLHQVTGKRWFNAETELEAGCGIVPVEYKNKSLIHSIQWAIGLEWYLLVKNPWQISMSTDHPNGAAFLAYPEIIHLLMSKDYRREKLKELPESIRSRCSLWEIDREYSLYEIAIITRAAPARQLGLTSKGHLGIGADADLTIYQQSREIEQMFATPYYVIKSGEIIVDRGQLKSNSFGPTWWVSPEFDEDRLHDLSDWIEKWYSIDFKNYSVDSFYLSRGSKVINPK